MRLLTELLDDEPGIDAILGEVVDQLGPRAGVTGLPEHGPSGAQVRPN